MQESESVYTFEFEPENEKVFSYKAGQFAILKNIHVPAEIKHNFRSYSILHPFDGRKICFGIKIKGEFTSSIRDLEVGSGVEISGPFGLFLLPENACEKYVFLAGGVGITPLLCMIEGLLQKGAKEKIYLFYSNKQAGDIAYKKLLDENASKHPNFKVVYSITRECLPDIECERERVNIGMIRKYCKEIEGAQFFICGSKEFAEALGAQLLGAGVEKERVHCEKW